MPPKNLFSAAVVKYVPVALNQALAALSAQATNYQICINCYSLLVPHAPEKNQLHRVRRPVRGSTT